MNRPFTELFRLLENDLTPNRTAAAERAENPQDEGRPTLEAISEALSSDWFVGSGTGYKCSQLSGSATAEGKSKSSESIRSMATK